MGSADGKGGATGTLWLDHPYGVAADSSNIVYAADTGNDTFLKIDAADGSVTTIAGGAKVRQTIFGALPSWIQTPWAIAINSGGDLVMNTPNAVVQITAP